MAAKRHTIEVDETTAVELSKRAAERGLSVSQLLAELVRDESVALDAEQLAELDRRWDKVQARGAVLHDEVVRWLEAWGTPAYRPWRDQ